QPCFGQDRVKIAHGVVSASQWSWLATSFGLGVSELYTGAGMPPWTKPMPIAIAKPMTERGERATRSRDQDAWLVDACRQGDRRAMEALYHRFKRRVYGMVA